MTVDVDVDAKGCTVRGLRCWIGRHRWELRRKPEMGGPGAVYRVCGRCGREEKTYGASSHPVVDAGG